MRTFRRIRPQLKRAALLGALLVTLSHLPPFYPAQRLDGALLEAYARALPEDGARIVVVDLARVDAIPYTTSGTPATIVGPTVLALGPVDSPLWAEWLAWVLTIGAIAAWLGLNRRNLRLSLALALAGPLGLMIFSSSAFALGGLWVPIAGPALLLFFTGTTAIVTARPWLALPRATSAAARRASSEAPAEPAELLHRGDIEDAWLAYRDEPVTQALLPELYRLGAALADEGYLHLAADTFLRVALVDPEYRDVATRLVSAARPDAFTSDEAREQLRSEMPSQLGRYRLIEPIGKGTMGRVYLAHDPNINRLVAIKLIDLSLERDEAEYEDARERFRREAETTGRLSHPNIVTIHDMGETGGCAYIAMEFLKGDLLSSFTRPETLVSPALVLELGALAADALDYAHSHHVIHRDIKPANIMYDSISGNLKITDFGIARLLDVDRTRTGVVLGTPSFMAPEQIEGGNVKGHTDLFALGVSLYELLTGRLPFRANSMAQLMFVIANEPHEPVTAIRPDLPEELDSVIDTALQKEPSDRFQRGADMAEALRAVAAELS